MRNCLEYHGFQRDFLYKVYREDSQLLMLNSFNRATHPQGISPLKTSNPPLYTRFWLRRPEAMPKKKRSRQLLIQEKDTIIVGIRVDCCPTFEGNF